jgi:hypothetical protein
VVGVLGGVERGGDLVEVGVDVGVHVRCHLDHDILGHGARPRGSVVALDEVAVVVLERLLVGRDELLE